MMKQESYNKGTLLYLTFICFASAMGGLLFGYDLFVIYGAKDLALQHFGLSSAMKVWFVSSAMVGVVIGCVLAGKFSDNYSRQKALFVASLFLLICSLRCSLE